MSFRQTILKHGVMPALTGRAGNIGWKIESLNSNTPILQITIRYNIQINSYILITLISN